MTMRMNKYLWALCAVLALPVQAAVPANCDGEGTDTIRATTPTARFHLPQGYDVVVDKETGLLWARCPLGFRLERGACEVVSGEQRLFSWRGALEAVAVFRANDPLGSGYTDGWHLPNVKELASIIERQCRDPALNGAVFPTHPSGYYWTSTPVAQISAGAADDVWEERVWAVGTTNGGVTPIPKGDPTDPTTQRAYVLPVRELTDSEFQDWLSR